MLIMGDNTNWADITKDGRRMEKIIKQMDTKQQKCKDPELQLSYITTLIKATHQKVAIAEQVLNVRKLVKFAEQRKTPKQNIGELTV